MVVCVLRTFAIVLFAGALAACGGGGGSTGGAIPATPSSGNVSVVPTVSADANVQLLPASSGTISGTIRAGAHRAIVAVMSGAGDLGSSTSTAFAQDALALDTAAAPATQSAMRAPAAAVASLAAPVEAFPADDARAQSLLRRLTPANGLPAARSMQSITSTATGGTASIWVEKNALGSASGTYEQVPATLELQTAHGNIWIDSSLLSGSTAAAAFAPSSLAATIAAIGDDFENAYASDTAHFAGADYAANSPGLTPSYKACNGDGSAAGSTKAYIDPQARINVMVVNPSAFGSGMGGYFSAVNYMPQAALNCIATSYRSNEAPFIYVGWFDRNGSTYELKEDLVRGTAHELQHLINFVNHSLLGSAGTYEETFLNEGLSMLAQDFAVQRKYGVQFDSADALRRAQSYLAAPQNYSVSGFTGIDPGSASAQYNCGGGCYGSAYLFQRYLYDRLGGDAYAHAMETSGLAGAANLGRAASGEPFAQLIDDFGLALAAGSAGVTPKDARYAFGTLGLTATYPDQIGGRTSLGGVASLPMSGSALQVQAPLGGFAFVNFGSVAAAGQSFTITDRATVGGFAPVGGLVQQ